MALLWRGRARQEFRRLPVTAIRKNPNQPRKLFDRGELESLADSIRKYGVITPLTVRETDGQFELVAGERRLRAAVLAGLDTVPCFLVSVGDEESALMSLLENLQRSDLDCFEEAAFLRRLCAEFHLTQQEAAERIGRTQSAVANKLRLLKLPDDVIVCIRNYGLTERHARALLQLPDAKAQLSCAREMGEKQLTVAQAEALVQAALQDRPRQTYRVLVRDVRLFCNTVERAVRLMCQSGVTAKLDRRLEGDTLILTVRVPQAKKSAPSQMQSGGEEAPLLQLTP